MRKAKKGYVKFIFAAIFLMICAYILITFLYTPFEKSYSVEVQNSEKMIALTFDDGPGAYTQTLLDDLKGENIKATFFLLGKHIDGNEEIVAQIQKDGHLIGNHTYDHCTLFNTSLEDYIKSLQETDEKIAAITGDSTLFFRPPHGFYTGSRLNKIDKIAVLWSNDPADWKHEDADYVYDYLMKNAADGKIFLLHDTRQTTVEGVLRAIKDLKEQGYEFVRADELLCRNGDNLAAGLAYRACRNNGSPMYF